MDERSNSTGSAEGPSTRRGGLLPGWRRLTRTRRGAVGLGVAVAALLLWPFAGWSWIPWLAGLGAALLLRLLRLDGLLRGWTWHVVGLVVVAGLMLSSGPWAWALAASIGVLLAGLVRLPQWRLAAVGGVLCVVSVIGYSASAFEATELQRRIDQQRSEQSLSLLGERTPERVLPALLEGIAQSDVTGVCRLLDDPAREQFVHAAGAHDCADAVARMRAVLTEAPRLRDLDMTVARNGDTATTNACRTLWARPPLGGPELGVLDLRQAQPPGRTYFIAGFRPC